MIIILSVMVYLLLLVLVLTHVRINILHKMVDSNFEQIKWVSTKTLELMSEAAKTKPPKGA